MAKTRATPPAPAVHSARPASARRSQWMAIAGIILVGAVAVAWFRGRSQGSVTGPVILISIDTLRADRLPVYGYTAGRTPHSTSFARRGGRLRARLRARAANAAGSRLDVHRRAAVRAQASATTSDSRYQIRRERWPHCFRDARLRDRRIRLGFRAAPGNRHRPRVRRSTTRVSADGGRPIAGTGPAGGHRTLAGGHDLAEHARVRSLLPLLSHLRAAQAVHAARPVQRSRRRTTARSRLPTRSSGGSSTGLKRTRLLRSRDDRRCSRITAKASAITSRGAWPLSLRRGVHVPWHDEVAGQSIGRTAGGRADPAYRSAANTGGALATRRCRPGLRGRDSRSPCSDAATLAPTRDLRRGALPALSLRLERAARR